MHPSCAVNLSQIQDGALRYDVKAGQSFYVALGISCSRVKPCIMEVKGYGSQRGHVWGHSWSLALTGNPPVQRWYFQGTQSVPLSSVQPELSGDFVLKALVRMLQLVRVDAVIRSLHNNQQHYIMLTYYSQPDEKA